ncbi:MAG: radical SAM protein [Dehalogenimonas sp.]|uniref:Radical SAM protein n=1 Tax=Candidatus Dehalogenimonas loeffleri TaxID=3127115 RepID=A0ABZ2J171_9CHLR|nr:radical SAM protein [Dehalogenimonas sp.]
MVWNRALKDRFEAESGAVLKDWGGQVPAAIVFPNNYRLGMSNLGIHALYKWFNNREDFLAERVFWDEQELSTSGALSVESRRPLTDFSVLAFSVSWELDYFNIPRILRAAGLPVYARDRDESHPLIIGGGATLTANPAPTAAFFDAVCIGEAEAILPGLLDTLKTGGTTPRHQLLAQLATLPGIYVPGHSKHAVKRLYTADMDSFPVSTQVFTDDTEFGDMYLLEVQRGCRFACRFCLVAGAFCPFRWRSVEVLLSEAAKNLKYRNRVALVGPVVSEHPQILELLRCLREMGFSLSMGSMRVKPISTEVITELVKGGVKSLTIAPEAGSDHMRRAIGKGFSDDDVAEAVGKIGAAGIRQLTLYAMVGLPEEKDEDAADLAALVLRCKAEADKYRLLLSLNVSAFVPKPQTSFERQPMAAAADINRRFEMLSRSLAPRGVKVKPDNVDWGLVQAALSRGDERLAAVIETMDRMSLAGWRRAMKQQGLSTEDYAHRRYDDNEALPWGVVEM